MKRDKNFSDSECDKLHFEHIPQFLTWLACYKLRQIFLFCGGNFLSYYFTVSGGFISPRWFPPSFQGIMVNKNMILFSFQWLSYEVNHFSNSFTLIVLDLRRMQPNLVVRNLIFGSLGQVPKFGNTEACYRP